MVNTVIKKTTQTDKPVQLCATHSRRVERHDHRPVHETAGDQPRYVFLTQNSWQPLVALGKRNLVGQMGSSKRLKEIGRLPIAEHSGALPMKSRFTVARTGETGVG